MPAYSDIACFAIKMPYRPPPALHVHHFHEMYFAASGTGGEQYVSSGPLPMRKGSLFFFPAGHGHIGNGGPKNDSVGQVLYIGKQSFHDNNPGDEDICTLLRYLEEQAENEEYEITLGKTATARMHKLFDGMVGEQEQKKTGFRAAVVNYAREILLLILREHTAGIDAQTPPGRERMQEILDFIGTHYDSRLTVEQMARMAHLSRSHFHALFRAETGLPLVEYINRLRTGIAADKLRDTDIPISQIAQQCGFPCLSHFYAIYRRLANESPRTTRETTRTAKEHARIERFLQ